MQIGAVIFHRSDFFIYFQLFSLSRYEAITSISPQNSFIGLLYFPSGEIINIYRLTDLIYRCIIKLEYYIYGVILLAIAQIIKYEGDNSTFIWKHPCEDFNALTQLIVHESQEAIFFMNGQALDLFGPGRYTLETQNIPILKEYRSISALIRKKCAMQRLTPKRRERLLPRAAAVHGG